MLLRWAKQVLGSSFAYPGALLRGGRIGRSQKINLVALVRVLSFYA
jgi:hypothetical protein